MRGKEFFFEAERRFGTLGRALGRRLVARHGLRPARWRGALAAVRQAVGQLDQLEPEPARAQAPCREHGKRLDKNHSPRPLQPPPRNHQPSRERRSKTEYWRGREVRLEHRRRLETSALSGRFRCPRPELPCIQG